MTNTGMRVDDGRCMDGIKYVIAVTQGDNKLDLIHQSYVGIYFVYVLAIRTCITSSVLSFHFSGVLNKFKGN